MNFTDGSDPVTSRLQNNAHSFVTKYVYNSLKQLVQQYTPDGDTTDFWYDRKGQLRFSQNKKQFLTPAAIHTSRPYSYTKYDRLGRIIEVGESTQIGFADDHPFNYPDTAWFPGGGKEETYTVYSDSANVYYLGMKPQRYLQNRVSHTYTEDSVYTYFSYDPYLCQTEKCIFRKEFSRLSINYCLFYKRGMFLYLFQSFLLIMKRFFRTKLHAFTLTELLVVMAIVGILVLLALPNLMPMISKAKSTEAQLQLEHVFTLEKSYFFMHSKYSAAFSDIGFEQAKLVKDGGNANYNIEIVDAGLNAFKVRATAATDFDGDGTFNIWEIDQDKNLKEVTPD